MIRITAQRRVIGCALRASTWQSLLVFARFAGVAAMLGVHAGAAAQEDFGRLFFSTEERRMMSQMRNDDVEPQSAQVVTRGETVSAPVVDVISFDGKVERSGSGSSTVWVNGRPVVTGSRTAEGISVNPSRGTSGETLFVLPPSEAGETNFSLKVGQKIAVQSGKVLDSYEDRAAEDAESVFATVPPADAAVPSDGAKSSKDAGASATPVAPGGS